MTRVRQVFGGRAGRVGARVAALVVVGFVVVPLPARAAVSEPTPLDVVVAVDESGSLQEEDVRQEIEAASAIAQSALTPRTRVTVLGFGSDRGGRGAVNRYCRPTVVATAADLEYLAGCVKGLHRREPREGNDTDHVAALSEALSVLESGSPDGALRTVFLLTDGRLDVSDSPRYGEGDRNAEAQRRLAGQLRRARAARVQVWPLGFGPEVDRGGLERFAAGGSQQACDRRPESRPWARVVNDSRQVVRSLVEAYAAASCYMAGPTVPGSLRAGESLELPLTVPGVASEATLTVARRDPRVRVEFVDPKGNVAPSGGNRDGSVFTRGGGRGTIEALRVTNPLNGVWKVRFTAPEGTGVLPVAATVLYQGVIRAALTAEPPNVRAGEPVTVRLSLVTRMGKIADPGETRGLTFEVTSSTGQRITVRDDGRAPDDAAGDGSHAGTFTAAGPGEAVLTGTVAGPGIRSERNPTAKVTVTARPPDVLGRVEFAGDTEVHPGEPVPGTVRMTNVTGRPVRARIVLDAPPQIHAKITTDPVVTVPPGASTHAFTVRPAPQAALGRAAVTVRVVDEADPAKVYAVRQRGLSVTEPPGWVERHLTAILAVLVVGAAAVLSAWLLRRHRRARRDVRRLRVMTRRDGGPVRELRPPRARWAAEFRFVVDDDRPVLTGTGDAYVARFAGPDRVEVRGPGGRTVALGIGVWSEPWDGLRLKFEDGRPPSRPRQPPRPAPTSTDPLL
ncbi:VWA domain-containing protein [Spirillospora sp. CA-253888]